MAKTKSSKLRLRSKLKFDKTLLAVIAVVVTIAGGYWLYQSSRAATQPPIKYAHTKLVGFTTTDGVKSTNVSYTDGSVWGECMAYVAKSSFGNFTMCHQIKFLNGTDKMRIVTHNFATGKYVPDSDWLPSPTTGAGVYCKNTNNYFYSNGSYFTSGFGVIHNGQQYRQKADGNWKIDLTNYSPITGNCNAPDVWYDIVGTW